MKYRKLGHSDIEVSEISLGCWTLGGLNWVDGVPNGWANVDENEVTEAVNFAIENGVNHFDNADVYGNGRAERLLAKILGNRTNSLSIATKVGWFKGTAIHAYLPHHIRQQCIQSLINLNREYIDLYYFHHADFDINDKYLDDAVAEMYKLKDEGKIRAIGLSAYRHEDFVKLIPKIKPAAIQSFANILDNRFLAGDSPTKKVADEHNTSFVAFEPLSQGVLLGKYHSGAKPNFEAGDHRVNSKRFSPDYLNKIESFIKNFKEIFGSKDEQLARASFQYLLSFDTVGTVIPGFRNLKQVRVNLALTDKSLTHDELNKLNLLINKELSHRNI